VQHQINKSETGCQEQRRPRAGQDGISRCEVMHVLRTTELRQEWSGSRISREVRIIATQMAWPPSQSCYNKLVVRRTYGFDKAHFGKRALATLGCLALLYFAAGGASSTSTRMPRKT